MGGARLPRNQIMVALYRTHTPRTPTCAQGSRACDAYTLRAQSQPQRAEKTFLQLIHTTLCPIASSGRISRQTSATDLPLACSAAARTTWARLPSGCTDPTAKSQLGPPFGTHTHHATASSARGAHGVMMIPIKHRRRQPSNLAGGGGGDGDPCCTYMAHERCTQRA